MKALLLVLLLSPFAAIAHASDLRERVEGKRLELAALLVEAVDGDMICDIEAYPSEINRLVSVAWYGASDAQKSAFLAKVPAGSVIRKDLAFRSAIHEFSEHDMEQSVEQFAASLVGTIFHKFGMGAFGSPYNVTLLEGGVAVENTAELLDEEPWHRWNESRTSWSVRKVKERFSESFWLKIGDLEYRLRVGNIGGEYWWVPVDANEEEGTDYQRTLTTDPGYCDA
jgi:hypothetical protein